MPQERRMLVLRAVVEDYIRSQEPVGSAALTKAHDLGVSSATIRNDMAALEDEGYLIQPHTSAGRVPTEKGYRCFVDRLATVMPLSDAQRRGIDVFLSGSTGLQEVLRRASRLLAQITGQVAVVASPSLARSALRHIELVPVSGATLLAVVITDTGRVAQHDLAANPMPAPETLARFIALANRECAGLSLTAAARRLRALATEAAPYAPAHLAEELAHALASMADDERASELYVSGASSLTHQRAVADLAPLFDALEEQVVLMKLMSALSEESLRLDGVGVAIGSETHTPGLLHASVVAGGYGGTPPTAPDGTARTTGPHASDASVHDDARQEEGAVAVARAAGGEPVAFVGSIGPTHMDYAATISAVRAVARYLTAFLSRDGTDPESPAR